MLLQSSIGLEVLCFRSCAAVAFGELIGPPFNKLGMCAWNVVAELDRPGGAVFSILCSSCFWGADRPPFNKLGKCAWNVVAELDRPGGALSSILCSDVGVYAHEHVHVHAHLYMPFSLSLSL
jgi:hypothetical protein